MKISLNTSGLDCSGKQTFNEALFKVLSDNGITPYSNAVFSFPRYEDTEEGRALYHLLRAKNKPEMENIISDLFYNDHRDFLETSFPVFINSESSIIMCDRCSHEPLIFNIGESFFSKEEVAVKDLDYWNMKRREQRALQLISQRHSSLKGFDVVELNLFFMMNNGKSDSDELKRRLDLKQDKDSNETLEFQKTINGRFKKVFEVIDDISEKVGINDRVFNIGFSLSTPTETIITFFLEFSKLVETYKPETIEFKNRYKEIIYHYSTFGYICMSVL